MIKGKRKINQKKANKKKICSLSQRPPVNTQLYNSLSIVSDYVVKALCFYYDKYQRRAA
uniref:Uncharacterized protein n=1 Tax=Octopus bimaculoides TaxID=37653 RepID=A0A0L8GHE6_OCTBM